ncbi:uncharacterized protein LOC108112246 [Drosophila eugracilis]|uniref:uncharacterized protein LOC108112246 n=1 Tax=Drosophila eugracilis TaxID=29029 RepID=UPI0007E85B8E|nr:uncharacterized protein LOC108112246 [Drosophila eugracilis]
MGRVRNHFKRSLKLIQGNVFWNVFMFQLLCASREMKTLFAWIPWVALLISHVGGYRFLEESCSAPKQYQSQNETLQQYATWMAYIRNATHYICTGTLINKDFVLTTADCVQGHDELFIGLGAYKKTEPAQMHGVSHSVVHSLDYSGSLQNNIGLLKLSNSVDYNERIQPICINLDKNWQIAKDLKTFGWRPKNNKLHAIALILSKQCQLNLNADSDPKNICAVAKSRRASCHLESGAPLTSVVNDQSNVVREVQIGILKNAKINCNDQFAYIDLSSYVEWIEATVKRFDIKNHPRIPPQQPIVPKEPNIELNQGRWLYEKCQGYTLSSKLHARIYGPNFSGQGWFITDRFIITNAYKLPDNAVSLDVGLVGTLRRYDEFRVVAVFKHPQFSDDFKNDLALLKVNKQASIDNMTPICMPASTNYEPQEESSLITFDHVQTEDRMTIYPKPASVENSRDCSYRIQNGVQPNQICVEVPSRVSRNYGKSGDVLAKKIMFMGQERLVLVGINSYSTSGVQVFTNITSHTDWIVNTVSFN